eukprot:6214127-Pleurochrysis_carterae.AAC.4
MKRQGDTIAEKVHSRVTCSDETPGRHYRGKGALTTEPTQTVFGDDEVAYAKVRRCHNSLYILLPDRLCPLNVRHAPTKQFCGEGEFLPEHRSGVPPHITLRLTAVLQSSDLDVHTDRNLRSCIAKVDSYNGGSYLSPCHLMNA